MSPSETNPCTTERDLHSEESSPWDCFDKLAILGMGGRSTLGMCDDSTAVDEPNARGNLYTFRSLSTAVSALFSNKFLCPMITNC